MAFRFWTPETCERAVNVLRESESMDVALKRISKAFRRNITKDAITNGLRANSFQPPGFYLGGDEEKGLPELDDEDYSVVKNEEVRIPERTATAGPVPTASKRDEEVETLMASIKRKPLDLRALCDDVFDRSPKYVEEVVIRAQKAGYSIELAHGTVGFKVAEPNTRQQISIPMPKRGKEVVVGVFSDVHVGSKYHLKDAWVDHIHHCYEMGVRDFFCAGDLLEGCYRHAEFELSQVGWEDQATEAIRSMPNLPGLNYHFIDGNHDFTFTDRIGMESGRNLVRLSREMGREDIFFYGSRGALINYGGTRIELWHPKKGMGYALSYPLQNHIRDTEPQDRPHILLAGHWHQFVQVEQGGVYAVACGTFQHGKGPFGKSLGGSTAIGGVVLRWSMGDDGRLAEFSAQHRAYPYREPEVMLQRRSA